MKATYACIALFMGTSHAACPNGCSNHGVCGENDSCTCHANWFGADCSQRQCMSYKSWITTGQGDLNYDGDREDATVYQADTEFTKTSLPYLITQQNPGGDWEYWPSKFSSVGEAHFYMECSNRGLCNRDTGECECFAGYTGEACRRTMCPDDCNGRGLCLTVAQQGTSNSIDYNLWDHDMSRSCVCDPGFSGPSCANKNCPTGDDPLTTNQQHETQWIDLYADTGEDFDGTITLTYTDNQGHARTTNPASVLPHSGGTATATAVQAALRALPNDALGDVVVSEEYCAQVIPGNVAFNAGDIDTASTDPTSYVIGDGDAFYCPGATAGNEGPYTYDQGNTQLLGPDGSTVVAVGTQDDLLCYTLKKVNCNRLKITFGGEGSTGNVASISVDTAGVTLVSTGESDANELDNFQMTSTSSDVVEIAVAHGTGGVTVTYTAKATHDKTCAAGSCSISSSTKVITLDADADDFGSSSSERIKVWCGSTKVFGTYTVSSVTGTTQITVTESIPDCDGTSGNEVIVKRVTDYLLIDGTDATGIIPIGSRLEYADAGVSKGVTNEVLSTHYTGGTGTYVYLDNDETESTSKDFSAGDIATTTAATNSYVKIYGIGTTEKSTCSDRGVCDEESGDCECFPGYTGLACQFQNALSA